MEEIRRLQVQQVREVRCLGDDRALPSTQNLHSFDYYLRRRLLHRRHRRCGYGAALQGKLRHCYRFDSGL